MFALTDLFFFSIFFPNSKRRHHKHHRFNKKKTLRLSKHHWRRGRYTIYVQPYFIWAIRVLCLTPHVQDGVFKMLYKIWMTHQPSLNICDCNRFEIFDLNEKFQSVKSEAYTACYACMCVCVRMRDSCSRGEIECCSISIFVYIRLARISFSPEKCQTRNVKFLALHVWEY